MVSIASHFNTRQARLFKLEREKCNNMFPARIKIHISHHKIESKESLHKRRISRTKYYITWRCHRNRSVQKKAGWLIDRTERAIFSSDAREENSPRKISLITFNLTVKRKENTISTVNSKSDKLGLTSIKNIFILFPHISEIYQKLERQRLANKLQILTSS